MCDIVAVNLEEKPLRFEGIAEGKIAEKIDGNSGFGYDPIFVSNSLGKTFASMDKNEKNNYSHRALALKKFLTYLRINGFIKK